MKFGYHRCLKETDVGNGEWCGEGNRGSGYKIQQNHQGKVNMWQNWTTACGLRKVVILVKNKCGTVDCREDNALEI